MHGAYTTANARKVCDPPFGSRVDDHGLIFLVKHRLQKEVIEWERINEFLYQTHRYESLLHIHDTDRTGTDTVDTISIQHTTNVFGEHEPKQVYVENFFPVFKTIPRGANSVYTGIVHEH